MHMYWILHAAVQASCSSVLDGFEAKQENLFYAESWLVLYGHHVYMSSCTCIHVFVSSHQRCHTHVCNRKIKSLRIIVVCMYVYMHLCMTKCCNCHSRLCHVYVDVVVPCVFSSEYTCICLRVMHTCFSYNHACTSRLPPCVCMVGTPYMYLHVYTLTVYIYLHTYTYTCICIDADT